MIERNFLCAGEELHPDAQTPLGVLNGGESKCRVCLHDLELFRIKFAGLQQDAVRDADLADIVKRSGLEKNINLILRQVAGETGMRLQLLCQGSEIVLGAY